MKRVLVTGARGFIGRHCLDPLRARGFEIHAVSSMDLPDDRESVFWHRADLLDAAQASTLVSRVAPTHALHLAWVTTPGQYWTSPDNERWAASGATLFDALVEHGATRIVGAGTCAEYDWSTGHCDEALTPCVPSTPYGRSKHVLHSTLEQISVRGGMQSAWGRIFYLYGPGEHPARLVPSVILSLLKNERARCSSGTQVRDFLHVADVADAFAALLDSDVSGPVNIASGSAVSVRDLVLRIAALLGCEDRVDFGAPAAEPHKLTASTERLSTEVGWRPRHDLEGGLSSTIEWWNACASSHST